MAGGQSFTSAAGSLGRSVTLALAGAAVALSAGSVTPNNENVVPLTGTQVAVSQTAPAVGWGQALSGSAITSSDGSVTITLRPTDAVGQAITSAAGIASASGSSVTSNLSGVEATFGQGIVTGGTQLLSGIETTSAAGTATYGLAVPVSGIASTVEAGTISPSQGADDTLITSSEGTVVQSAAVALVGTAVTAAQGNATASADAFSALNGIEVTASAGTIAHDEQFALVGSSVSSSQGSLGAPGGAALSGSQVTASAGSVFLTSDREFALSGQAVTVSDGLSFASPLAFVDGQELTLSQEGIGPRNAALAGASMTAAQGDVTPPRAAGGLPGNRFNRPRFLRLLVREEEEEVALEDVAKTIKKMAKIAAVEAKREGGTKPPAIKILGGSRSEGKEIRQAFKEEFAKNMSDDDEEDMILWLI